MYQHDFVPITEMSDKYNFAFVNLFSVKPQTFGNTRSKL